MLEHQSRSFVWFALVAGVLLLAVAFLGRSETPKVKSESAPTEPFVQHPVTIPVAPISVLQESSPAVAETNSIARIQAIPQRPEELTFDPLSFEPPDAAEYRKTLPDGTAVYLAPSHEFPLIAVSLSLKGGASLDPVTLPGLAAMTSRLVREGGTMTVPSIKVDEQFDFMATEVSVSSGDISTTATMNSLASNFDESLTLFVDMLRNPAFETPRIQTAQARILEGLKQRNDDASSILSREWKRLLFGPDHFESSEPTDKTVQAIGPDQLRQMHARIFHPGNMIVSVSGDFEIDQMMEKLSKALEGWERGEVAPDPIAPTAVLEPGLYHIPKSIPQGKVALGSRSIVRDDPDAIAMLLLNDILGGGGFTSRIMQQVRSNEGLAYSARSSLAPRVSYPGEFRAGFESKNPTVALATKIVLDQIRRVREEPVTAEELETAKQSLIETFPRSFESKPQMLRVFVNDEWTHRPKDYWKTFRQRVSAVTVEDLQRVAKKHLDPEKMAILVVGDWDAIAPGDLDKRASMNDFFNGAVKHIPLRDPLSLEP